ncbi:hypothetical protein AAV33_09630, partial [Corynebacterium otitidis]
MSPAGGRPGAGSPESGRADLEGSAGPGLDVDVLAWRDGDDAPQRAADRLGGAPGPVGCGASLTADHLLPLMEKLPGREARLAAGKLLHQREEVVGGERRAAAHGAGRPAEAVRRALGGVVPVAPGKHVDIEAGPGRPLEVRAARLGAARPRPSPGRAHPPRA